MPGSLERMIPSRYDRPARPKLTSGLYWRDWDRQLNDEEKVDAPTTAANSLQRFLLLTAQRPRVNEFMGSGRAASARCWDAAGHGDSGICESRQ